MASTITGLRSDLLPHRLWGVSKWFYANPLWYYHRRGTDEEIVANRKFYQLVDPELREVCKVLNDAGLHTTPSCQGHFYGKDRFEKIWDELKREEPLVRGGGLKVKDSETDREFMFVQPEYIVPWENFERFYAEAAAHQGTGYLGIVVWPERAEVGAAIAQQPYRTPRVEMAEDAELGRMLGGSLFHAVVRCENPQERAQEWGNFTGWVKEILGRSSGPAVESFAADQEGNRR